MNYNLHQPTPGADLCKTAHALGREACENVNGALKILEIPASVSYIVQPQKMRDQSFRYEVRFQIKGHITPEQRLVIDAIMNDYADNAPTVYDL